MQTADGSRVESYHHFGGDCLVTWTNFDQHRGMAGAVARWKRACDARVEAALSAIDGAPRLTLLVIGAAHVLVRLLGIGRPALWADEAFNLWWARHSPRVVIESTLMTPDPPLYNLALAGWLRMFGTSEAAARAPSALFAIATALGVFLLARAWISGRAALYASLLLLFSGSFQNYAHEVRSTTLACALAVASLLVLDSALRRPGARSVIALALIDAALVYTHYLTAFFLLAQLVIVVVAERPPGALGRYVASRILAFSLVIPLLVEVIRSHMGPTSWLVRPDRSMIVGGLDELGGGRASLIAALTVIALGAWVRRTPRERRRRLALVVWAVLPLATVLLVSFRVPMFHARYVLYSLPALTLLAAEALAALPGGGLIQLALVGLVLAAGALGFELSPAKNQRWDETARYVREIPEKSAILLQPRWQLYAFAYYFDRAAFDDPAHTEARLSTQGVHTLRPQKTLSAAELGFPSSVVLVQSAPQRVDPANSARDVLSRDYAVSRVQEVGGQRVTVFHGLGTQTERD